MKKKRRHSTRLSLPSRPSRRNSNWLTGAVIWSLALTGGGCGVLSQEEQLLLDFFQAARLRDTTALARFGSADFNPRTEGIVQDFDVVDVAPLGDADNREARDVSVVAQVRRPDGSTEPRTLHFTMERRGDGRLIITGVRPAR
jgi:hypothetical protein